MTEKKIERRDFLRVLGIGTTMSVWGYREALCRAAERSHSRSFLPSTSPKTPRFAPKDHPSNADGTGNRRAPARSRFSGPEEFDAVRAPVCDQSLEWSGYTPKRPNVLIITVDDMAYDSLGINGSSAPNPTPNIDRLAKEGIRFAHSHVNIAVCQPCRGTIATGRYPHRSGIEGFEHTSKKIPTIMQTLKDNGYLTGIFCKTDHCTPHAEFVWDTRLGKNEMCHGRAPERYYERTKRFIAKSQRLGKPFYLMANSQDPHRPFAGAAKSEAKLAGCHFPPPSRTYTADEVPVPGFLPDLPDVKTEVARYFGSVRRADDTLGAVLRALDECGETDHTIVAFISDHGMSFPFSKANCYPQSTRVPWIMRWPGVIPSDTFEKNHFISTIDFMPTILEAVGLPVPKDLDGRSFMPLLKGAPQKGRDKVFTQFYRTSKENVYPMRCVETKRYCYIFNPWSNGKRKFIAESMQGLTFEAMHKAAKTDQAMAERVKFFEKRVLEELYDLKTDPFCLNNLIDDRRYQKTLQQMRHTLEQWMIDTGDRALRAFKNPQSRKAREDLVKSTRKRRPLSLRMFHQSVGNGKL